MTRTLSGKLVPPRVPASYVRRKPLLESLDRVFDARLTGVVGGAGFGKSTLLGEWARRNPCAWYTIDRGDRSAGRLAAGLVGALRLHLPAMPEGLGLLADGAHGPDLDELLQADALAGALCELLEDHLHSDLALVVDDVHELGAVGASIDLLHSLCRQAPSRLHLVVSSRAEIPFPVQRLRGQGDVLDISAGSLAFNAEEVGHLVNAVLPDADGALIVGLHAATRGWPAALRLAVESLRAVPVSRRAAAVAELHRPGGAIFDYLAEEVFSRESAEVTELLRRVAVLDRFSPELCDALGITDAGRLLDDLLARGLFLEAFSDDDGWWSLHGLIRDAVVRQLPLTAVEKARVHHLAAEHLIERGRVAESLGELIASRDIALLSSVLDEHGPRLLAAGEVERVLAAAEHIPLTSRTSAIHMLCGQARLVHGDWDGALSIFAHLGSGAVEVDPGLAWRVGLIHQLKGDLTASADAYSRARLGDGSPVDDAMVLAGSAVVHWLRGDLEPCRAASERAMEAAESADSLPALAAAHMATALVSAIDPHRPAVDPHYERALDAAERGRDVLQVIRIRVNSASRMIGQGAYAASLEQLEVAINLAEMTGFAAYLGMALNNRGEARLRLGQVEAAMTDFETARATLERIGSRNAAYSLVGIADIHRLRGEFTHARSRYDEALDLARSSGDRQALVVALGGLSRLLVRDFPDEATALVEEMLLRAGAQLRIDALLAAGWVELALTPPDRRSAAAHADEAVTLARSKRERSLLAEALELSAMAQEKPDLAMLEEAAGLCAELADPIGGATAQLAVARVSGAPPWVVAHAERRLRALGIRIQSPAASLLATLQVGAPSVVSVQTLGAFRVVRAGQSVSLTDWGSRAARDVLKWLIAKRGRPIDKRHLATTLFPDDPANSAERLAVAVDRLRVVLDPDGGLPSDHFVRDDGAALALELGRIAVDVEQVLADAEAGAELRRAGQVSDAIAVWESAEAACAGEFLEEESSAEWALPLREEARAAYVSVVRALAEAMDAMGDVDAAVRYRLRLLERDPYDEHAHLGLVTAQVNAGRHGEARRSYRRYVGSIQELGLEAAPFPAAG